VDVFAFSQESLHHVLWLTALRCFNFLFTTLLALLLFFNGRFTPLLSSFLEGQVQIQWQHLWVALIKVFTASDLAILQLVQD